MRQYSLHTAGWQFRDATKRSPWRSAQVPGCVHQDLKNHGLIPDPFWASNEASLQWIEERDWEYKCSFTLPDELKSEAHIELVADGLDTVATVFLNGRELARTENMFTGYRWEIKPNLRRGTNELLVRFTSAMSYIREHRTDHQPRELNDPVGRCTVIRKQQCQFGWDWAPRFVTAGIWRDLRLESWTGNRLKSVLVSQDHRADGTVLLNLSPELERSEDGLLCHWRLTLGRTVVGEGQGTTIEVEHPQLWWPNGQGNQPLYRLEVEVVRRDGTVIDNWIRRIGLRTVRLDRHADQWGESFQFVVNGRAIFAKGANWIPAHCFVAGLKRSDYERDLTSAAKAHMNMVRVWGGGIYETENFYDICDELGLLVWQDFMFACTRYPADEAFVQSVREEAEYQVRRLRHRACLALWCGNNEVFGCNADEIAGSKDFLGDYERVFHEALPAVVEKVDGVTAYWPGSPWRGDRDTSHAAGVQRGDTHYWDVWHGRRPVKDYEKHAFRFVSEFGMQSFSSPETQATFCPHDDANVFGKTMKYHQKNRGGNQVILDYVSRSYRFPKNQDALIYLSQLNQANCMQTGVEHWRRNMPRCMGALYWQINDCWPVSSWSSIEFTGRWKALHHVARRFFAPALVCAQVIGEETETIGNYRKSTVSAVELYTVYDAPAKVSGVLRWDLFHLDGRHLKQGEKKVTLKPGEAVNQKKIDLAGSIATHGTDSLYLRIALEIDSRRVSEDTVFLAPPRYLALPKARTSVAVDMLTPNRAKLTFTSAVLQHRFAFDLPGIPHRSSDNFFELYPEEPKAVEVEFPRTFSPAKVRAALVWHSLVDTY
ncbi:MAG: glycoside hydrolase family 2 protein [Nibricoccus sp.]